MKFQDIVALRQSVRQYTDREVTDEQVLTLLEWAHSAPSAGNLRPWEFIVIRDREQLKRICGTTFFSNSEDSNIHQDWMLTAPVTIAVCADEEKIGGRYGKTSIFEQIKYLDCSAAVENILLGAVELGLSGCYMCGFRTEELRRVLSLPKNVTPVALIPIGYEAKKTPRRQRVPVKELIHREQYGTRYFPDGHE